MPLPKSSSGDEFETVRLPLRLNTGMDQLSLTEPEDLPNDSGVENESDDGDDVEELPYRAEFRTVKKDDPEAYNFGTAPYSAHKLPKEVVEAGCEGGDAWKLVMEQWERLGRGEKLEDDSSDDDDDPVEEFGN